MEDFDTVRKLWKHQADTLELAKNKSDYALFFEPGGGKSLTSIVLSRYKMYKAGRAMRVLVLSPPITLQNWKNEWVSASKYKPEQIVCLVGDSKKRAKLLENAYQNHKVVIVNYEAILNEKVLSGLKAYKPEIIIYDECHRVRNYASKRCKVAMHLSALPSVKHRYILSGTPVLNSPLDLFAQFRILDLGETFGTNFFTFRATYFFDANAHMPPHAHFPNWKIRPNSLDAITKKIASKSVFIEKSKCLDLPPLLKKSVHVELSSLQKRLYKSLVDDLIAYVDEGKACVAKLALTKMLRLMQIVSGFVAVEGPDGKDRSETIIADNPRAEALEYLLEELSVTGKVIVWASFVQNYETIRGVCKKLSLPYVEIHGGVSAEDKYKAVDAFNNDPNIRVCIGNAGSGGIGINLIAAPYAIFYSRNFSLEHDIQAEARNYRGGSEIHEKIIRYDLIAKDTIDELIIKRLEGKQDISDKILNDLVLELKEQNGTKPSKHAGYRACEVRV